MSRPLRLIRRVLVTICSVAVFAAAVAQARGGLLAQPSLDPGLAIVAMVAAVGGLQIGGASCRERGRQHASPSVVRVTLKKNSRSLNTNTKHHNLSTERTQLHA